MTLATNYLGPFLLTELLLDLLKESSPSRIINITSGIHRWARLDLDCPHSANKTYHFMKDYPQSKLMLTIYTFVLAHQLENTGVTVNCVHPGGVKTSLGSNINHPIVLKIMNKVIKFFLTSPRKAAQSIIELAISSEFEKVTGKYFVNGKPEKSKNPQAYDPNMAKKIFKLSRQLLFYPSDKS